MSPEAAQTVAQLVVNLIFGLSELPPDECLAGINVAVQHLTVLAEQADAQLAESRN